MGEQAEGSTTAPDGLLDAIEGKAPESEVVDAEIVPPEDACAHGNDPADCTECEREDKQAVLDTEAEEARSQH